MTTVYLPEARASLAVLSDDQALALTTLGVQLAGEAEWWGSSPEDEANRSVIRPTKQPDGRWLIEVGNVVGVVGLPNLTIIIEPKVGIDHFAHLLSRARSAERVSVARSSLGSADDLQRLVVKWFVLELDSLLRMGLVRDYVDTSDALAFVRGHVNLGPTSRSWLSGRLSVDCSYEDFTEDTPLNRTLAAAAQHAARSPWVDESLRQDLLRILRQLPHPGFGAIPHWRAGEFPPRERHYSRAIRYAQDVLAGSGRRLADGDDVAGTFLMNSARVAEEGIRAVLAAGLAPTRVLKTGGRKLLPDLVAVQPDLEIGPPPFTGDVKYKIGGRSWNRQDLAQSVLFAAAYRSQQAVIADFTDLPSAARTLFVGDIRVTRVRWEVGPGTTPASSELLLLAQIHEQLGAELVEWGDSAI